MEDSSIDIEFGDMDEFNAAVAGWDLEFRQIQRGSISAGVTQRRTARNIYTQLRFSRAIAQRGAPAAGMLTFGLVETAPWVQWRGHEFKPPTLLRFRPAHEVESISSGGFSAISLSFEESELASIAERLGHPDLLANDHSAESVLRTEPGHLQRLHRMARHALIAPPSTRDTSDSVLCEPSMDADIGIELITLLAQCDPEPNDPTLTSRSRVVRSAVDYILDNAHEAVTVADVCAATRVSFRTLDRAFLERLGASPKDCITGVRLQGTRLELKQSGPATRIVDIANRWGFWHLGDFARVYRREFNELPSETLLR